MLKRLGWEQLIAPIGRFAVGAADPFLVFAGDSLDSLPIQRIGDGYGPPARPPRLLA